MTLSNIELYEAIRANDWEKAARMIAEAVPAAQDLTTKSDLVLLKGDLDEVRRDLEGQIRAVEQRVDRMADRFDERLDAMEKRFFRWLMVFVAPLWAGVIAALVRLTIFGTF